MNECKSVLSATNSAIALRTLSPLVFILMMPDSRFKFDFFCLLFLHYFLKKFYLSVSYAFWNEHMINAMLLTLAYF